MATEVSRDLSLSTAFPGFKFSPTDIELLSYYLKRKMDGLESSVQIIPEVDIYNFEPWDLPGLFFLLLLLLNLSSCFLPCFITSNVFYIPIESRDFCMWTWYKLHYFPAGLSSSLITHVHESVCISSQRKIHLMCLASTKKMNFRLHLW